MKQRNNLIKQHMTSLHFYKLLLIPILLLTIINCYPDQKEINYLNQRIDDLTKTNQNLQNTTTGTTIVTVTVISNNPTIVTNLQNQLAQLQNQLSTISGANAEQITTLLTTIDQLQNTLSGANSTSSATISALTNQITMLQSNLNTVSGESTETISDLQSAINSFNTHKFIYEFDLVSENTTVSDIWSDGSTMWVLDKTTGRQAKIFAYDMATVSGVKQRLPNRDVNNLSGTAVNYYGIFADANTIWATNISRGYGDFLAYDLSPEIIRNGARDFRIDIDYNFEQAFSNRTIIYGIDNGDLPVIRAINVSDINHQEGGITPLNGSREFNSSILSEPGNTLTPRGIWADGQTLWVLDSDDDKIYAYNLQTKARIPSQDFNALLRSGNSDPYGLWSDGRTMWVGDRSDNKIYAYDMVTKSQLR